MSQLASFTYFKAEKVPFLGAWSKPQPRWFRRPECKFDEYLKPHMLREHIFDATDGIYVAFVFGWLELQDLHYARYPNPVVSTLHKNLGGAHWLVSFRDRKLEILLHTPLPESQWESFLQEIKIRPDPDLEWESFDMARTYVRDRISELQDNEALLVSIG